MDENLIVGLIPEQAILVDGIANMRGNHALSLNHNFKLKQVLYKLHEETVWMNYIVLDNFTTFAQLIGWLSSIHVITLESYNQDGFTMLISISSQNKL